MSALRLDLPKAGDWTDVPQLIVVELTAEGERSFEGERMDDDGTLLARLRTARERNPTALGLIKADKQARHQAVIRVLDLLRQAGMSAVAFAVSPTTFTSPKSSGDDSGELPAVK